MADNITAKANVGAARGAGLEPVGDPGHARRGSQLGRDHHAKPCACRHGDARHKARKEIERLMDGDPPQVVETPTQAAQEAPTRPRKAEPAPIDTSALDALLLAAGIDLAIAQRIELAIRLADEDALIDLLFREMA